MNARCPILVASGVLLAAGCGATEPTAPPAELPGKPAKPAASTTPPSTTVDAAASAAALPAAPIVPATWADGAWHARLGRRTDDLGREPERALTASDLPALGVGALEPSLELFRAGEARCTVTVTGYELSRPHSDVTRDGYYDETAVIATASGCAPPADHAIGWLVAPSFLAAQPEGDAWRLVRVTITDDGGGPRSVVKPLPKAYRAMNHTPACSKGCTIGWQVRRLPVVPAIEQVRITTNQWSDAGGYDSEPLDQGTFSRAGGKPRPLTFPSATLAGAFVVDDRPVVVLFDDGDSYASAAILGDTVDPETVSFVHQRVGY